MARTVAALCLAATVSCDPLTLAVLDSITEDTENFQLRNQTDEFYRKADHHDFKSTETYDWHNCGEQAQVTVSVKPSCPNDATVTIFDAEGKQVFAKTFHAGHCWGGKKSWDPLPTAAGAPGRWKIVLDFDISGVEDLEIHITRLGPEQVTVTTGMHDEKPYLRWHAVCTESRDVEESHPLPLDCKKVEVTVSWESLTSGTLEVTVKDGAGLIVFHHLFAPGHAQPHAEFSGSGADGTWTVTLKAVDLTSTNLDVRVQSQ